MDELISDSQIAPGSQAISPRAVADIPAARTPPISAVLHLMYVLPHPDEQTRPTPEAPPFTTHDTLCGVVARAVGLLIYGLLPVVAVESAGISLLQLTSRDRC